MGGYEHLALVGTTAVVTLVGTRMLYVANCGDSRAVLCRSGGAVPLTDDHKAAREDETVGAAGRHAASSARRPRGRGPCTLPASLTLPLAACHRRVWRLQGAKSCSGTACA